MCFKKKFFKPLLNKNMTEIEGKLMISIVEAKNLLTKGECNPSVKVSLTPKFYDKKGQEKQSNIEML